MSPDPAPPRNSPEPQVHGWKDISTYFGRSVRTVQRWEREFGLPIRRYGFGRGEVVHAYVEELERWRATAEAEAAHRGADGNSEESAQSNTTAGEAIGSGLPTIPPGPETAPTTSYGARAASGGSHPGSWFRSRFAPRGVILAALVTSLAVVATALAAWRWGPPLSGPRRGMLQGETSTAASSEPATGSVAGNTLTVFNADGEKLWDYPFPDQMTNRPQSVNKGEISGLQMVVVDTDGDGHREVLFRAAPADSRKDGFAFYAFSHKGDPLWTFVQSKPQVFGDTTYSPPFPADRIFATPRDGGGADVWLVSVHSPWFPSSMSRMEADFRVSAEYWSNGYISLVRGATIAGRRVVLVGARNNESEGASLAILDAATPWGSAPAESPQYECRSCPQGRPLRFVKMPKPARLRALRGTSPVVALDVDSLSRIVVKVDHAADAVQPGGGVVYTFDAELRPLSVGLYDSFDFACQTLVGMGAIPPLPKTPAIDEVRTVRWWDGTRFVDLTAPNPAPSPGPGR